MKQILFAALLFFSASAKAQSFEDFTLPSAINKSSFTLSEARGKFVAVHFLLKTECPYCIRHTHEYMEKGKGLSDVIQIFVKPDTEEEIKEWATNLTDMGAAEYPIYRDANAALAKRFNIPEGYQFHGQVVHYPALILLDREGKEVFRYVGKNNSDRYSFEKFRTKIQELK